MNLSLKARVAMLAVLVAAGNALAGTHQVGTAAELYNLFDGQPVNGQTLGLNDTVELTADITVSAPVTIDTIGRNVTITSAGGATRTVTRGLDGRFVVSALRSGLTLTNVTFAGGGSVGTNSLFLVSRGTLTLNAGATVTNVAGSGAGSSAIFLNANGVLAMNAGALIVDCSIENGNGGAIGGTGGTITIAGGTIRDCAASLTGGSGGSGGAIGGNLTITMTGGTIENCTAAVSGGAILNSGNLNMSGGEIRNCAARWSGGAISGAATITITGGSIEGCTASSAGGGIHTTGRLTMSGGAIRDCSVTGTEPESMSLGGGLWMSGTTWITGGTIEGCWAKVGGGGVYTTGTLKISGDPVIASNTANEPAVRNNVRLSQWNLEQTGAFSGSVGVSFPLPVAQAGDIFGRCVSGSGTLNFFSDANDDLRGTVSEQNLLVWRVVVLRAMQRYPWNNLVDVDYALPEDFTGNSLSFTMTDLETGNAVSMLTFRENTGTNLIGLADLPRTAGTYRVTWDANADGVAIFATNVAYTLAICAAPGDAPVWEVRSSQTAIDTRLGEVRMVMDPATDLLPFTYSAGSWVAGASGDASKTAAVSVVAASAWPGWWEEGTLAPAWYAGTNTVATYGQSDGSYDFWHDHAGPLEVHDSPYPKDRRLTYDGPGEGSFAWRQACWGLVKAVHSNETGALTAYFQFPEPCFDVTLRASSGTNRHEFFWTTIGEFDDHISETDFSRIGPPDKTAIDGWLDAVQANGLRRWENMVLGCAPTNALVQAIEPQEWGEVGMLPVRFSQGEPKNFSNWWMRYQLQRAFVSAEAPQSVVWRPIQPVSGYYDFHDGDDAFFWEDSLVEIPLFPDNVETNATGLYRIVAALMTERAAVPGGGYVEMAVPTATNAIPSANVTGVLRVDSVCPNTITAVPWRHHMAPSDGTLVDSPDYGEYYRYDLSAMSASTNVTVARATETWNLDGGDLLYAYGGSSNVFYGWNMAVSVATNELGLVRADRTLHPLLSVTANGVTTANATVERLPRGGAFWTVRAAPTANGAPRPYFLVGQHQPGTYTNVIAGVAQDVTNSTMCANPTAFPVAINNLNFVGQIGAQDTLVVPTANPGVSDTFHRNAANTQWGYSKKGVRNGRVVNTFITTNTIPAGTGFWYVRRAPGDLELVWPGWAE